MVWAIRTRSGLSINPAVIENKLTEASAGLSVGKVLPMDVILLRSTARSDFTTLLLAIFGVSALVLAAIGMYGLMAARLEQRTHEIGIGWRLGRNEDVQRMIVLQGMRLALAGAPPGRRRSLLAHAILASFCSVCRATIGCFAVVPLSLSLVALIAAWVPASRATWVAPMEALRQS